MGARLLLLVAYNCFSAVLLMLRFVGGTAAGRILLLLLWEGLAATRANGHFVGALGNFVPTSQVIRPRKGS